ncbi:uncharacterized protein PG986_004034 [Apiospora aurea]|uniref:2EXR domain-containing protein n=1 Tax=Apiospora aurea TaxID=335848 RepID=A0ABR1QLF9_9PEZI
MPAMKNAKGNEKKSSNCLRLRDAAKGTNFMLFPELPIELRRQIWRATWEPDVIGPYDLVTRDRRSYEPMIGLDYKPSITLQVNKESREETLRVFIKVPDSKVYIFRAFMNVKTDHLELDCTYKLLCPSMTREHFRRLERLILRTSEVADDLWYTPDESDEVSKASGYKTLGNFFHYPKKMYFDTLRELYMSVPFNLLDTSEMREEMRQSYRPILFRYKGSGGVHIEPVTVKGYCHGFRIRFLWHSEAARYGDGEPAEKHQAWLDFVGESLWNTFKPEEWLAEDRAGGYLKRRRDHQLV